MSALHHQFPRVKQLGIIAALVGDDSVVPRRLAWVAGATPLYPYCGNV